MKEKVNEKMAARNNGWCMAAEHRQPESLEQSRTIQRYDGLRRTEKNANDDSKIIGKSSGFRSCFTVKANERIREKEILTS